MLEDKILLWKFKTGRKDSFRAIYDKYADDLIYLAANLLNDTSAAEDVVQDVFVSFVQTRKKIHIKDNLKGYLLTSVANRCRDSLRRNKRQINYMENHSANMMTALNNPVQRLIHEEELKKLSCALTGLPYQQREVILLRLHGNLKFRQIAKIRNVSIKTAQSQYRYGLEKLRSIMNGDPLHPRRFASPNEAAGENAGTGVTK